MTKPRIESWNRLIEGARRVVGGLVVLEHSHGLLVGGEVTLLAAIDDLLAADAANSAARAADGLEELHRLIRLGVAGFGLQGLNGGLAAPVAVEEGDHGEAASRPVATGEVGALGVLTADEAGAAVGHQAQSTATGFGAAVAETGREFSSRGSGHVEIELEVAFLRLAS